MCPQIAFPKEDTKLSRFEKLYEKLCEENRRILAIGNLSQMRESENSLKLVRETIERLKGERYL